MNQLNNANDRKSQADARSQKSRAVSSYAASKRGGDVRSIASSAAPKTEAYSEINENDEWTAIQKFNTLLHFEEQKQAMLRDAERKRLIREELDRQINSKKERFGYENDENKAYDEMA